MAIKNIPIFTTPTTVASGIFSPYGQITHPSSYPVDVAARVVYYDPTLITTKFILNKDHRNFSPVYIDVNVDLKCNNKDFDYIVDYTLAIPVYKVIPGNNSSFTSVSLSDEGTVMLSTYNEVFELELDGDNTTVIYDASFTPNVNDTAFS